MKWEYKYLPDKGGDWPFRVTYAGPMGSLSKNRYDIDAWCSSTFEYKQCLSNGSSFWFKEKEHAEFFMLRWS